MSTESQDDTLDGGQPHGSSGEDGGSSDRGGEVQTVTVGDKQYTVDQITEALSKSNKFDTLLPEFTRKSQRLSELEGNKSEEKLPDYHNPDWKPETYHDLQRAMVMAEERGEKRALAVLEKQEQEMRDAQKELDDFITETKSKDSSFDEQVFYDFITEHKFPVSDSKDLESALGIFQDMQKLGGTKGTKAGDERINTGDGGESHVDLSEIRHSGGNLHDKGMAALERLK